VKIVLTGASSFTGSWFAKALTAAGHDVVATLRRRRDAYEGIRAERLELMRIAGVNLLEECSFGDDRFLKALDAIDMVCHHGAEVTNYHSPDFDVMGAVAANTAHIRAVMKRCADSGTAFVASGSVFEQGEGLGDAPLRAFSPYGLSKGLSWQVQDFWAGQHGVPISKFVIPNPFGPLEEARFCGYLMRTWAKGETAEVRTPAYVRDNIPVDLLALGYAAFVESFARERTRGHCAPSGYVESQGRFAERFGREIGERLGLKAGLLMAKQTEFAEPVMRINADPARHGWDEDKFWDEAADYYRRTYL
jgi:UDP-glucose 4-epimerase